MSDVHTEPHAQHEPFEAAVDAIVTGDVPALQRLLREHPDLIRARSTRPHHSTLLHYVGANGVEDERQKTPPNAVQVLETLLDAGAVINAAADMYGGGSTTLGLVATSIHPLRAGVQDALMAVLLDRGAAVGRGPDDWDAWSNLINGCHANGRPTAAEFLAARTNVEMLNLEAVAGLGRLDLVSRFFTADGTLRTDGEAGPATAATAAKATATATATQMKDGFAWACEYGRTEVVDFLLHQRDLAVDVRIRNHGQTGLHWAAFGGHVETMRVLLAHGAPVDAKDETFNGTALGWAIYAWSGGGPHPGDDRYYDIVRMLVSAGATVEDEWLAESSRGYPIAQKIREDPRMRDALGIGR